MPEKPDACDVLRQRGDREIQEPSVTAHNFCIEGQTWPLHPEEFADRRNAVGKQRANLIFRFSVIRSKEIKVRTVREGAHSVAHLCDLPRGIASFNSVLEHRPAA